MTPITEEFLTAFSRLEPSRIVRILSESYDPNGFGGATTLRMSVDALILEVETRDPKEPFEIELRCEHFKRWGRASYVRSFVEQRNSYDEALMFHDLVTWVAANFDTVYNLICGQPGELMDAFGIYAKATDAERYTQMIAEFKRNRR